MLLYHHLEIPHHCTLPIENQLFHTIDYLMKWSQAVNQISIKAAHSTAYSLWAFKVQKAFRKTTKTKYIHRKTPPVSLNTPEMTTANWSHPVHPSMKYTRYISRKQTTLFHSADRERSTKAPERYLLEYLLYYRSLEVLHFYILVFPINIQKRRVITHLAFNRMPSANVAINCKKYLVFSCTCTRSFDTIISQTFVLT